MRALFTILFVPCLLGQNAAPYFEATVTRAITAPPTEAVVDIYVEAQGGTTLEQVAGALQPAGVKATDLAGRISGWQHTPTPRGLVLSVSFENFRFRMLRSGDELTAVVQALELQRTARGLGRSVTYSVRFRPTATAIEAARKAVLPELFQQAQAKVAAMATAAGTTAGTVLAIEESLNTEGGLSIGVRSGLRPPFQAQSVRVGVDASVQPLLDEASIEVQVTALATIARSAVLQLAAQAGFGERELTGVSLSPLDLEGAGRVVTYQFSLTRPAREGELLVERTRTILRDRSPDFPSAQIGLSLGASDVSRTTAAERALPGIVAQARLRAEDYARLVGGRLGAVRSIAEGASVQPIRTGGNVIPASRIIPSIAFPPASVPGPHTEVEFAIE